jgi:hypothetical protein
MANVIETTFSQLKTAVEALQKVIETRDAIKIGETKATLLAQVNAAYEAALAIQKRESAPREEYESLKRKLMDGESLEARKARYELKTLPPRGIVCSLKPGMDATRDPQYACHTCYERGKISALHSGGVKNGIERFHCNECGSDLKTGTFVAPQVSTLSASGPWRRL